MSNNFSEQRDQKSGENRELTVEDLYKPVRDSSPQSSPLSPVSTGNSANQECPPKLVPFNENTDCMTGGGCDPNCRSCH
jgi:hypothetical protein